VAIGGIRSHKRFSVVGIQSKMLFATEVNILNISLGGAAIEADRRLNIGDMYTLKLQSESEALQVKGMVVWANISRSKHTAKGDTVPVYQAGIRFTDVVDEKITRLMDVIEGHKVVDENRLAGVRFIIEGGQSAELGKELAFKVRNLSLGGMLIETNHEFKHNDVFAVELPLPDDPVKVQVRVASCFQVGKGREQSYDVGVQFVDMSEETHRGLEAFLRGLGEKPKDKKE
jgi:Tfp pilus assembly protein PilZ